MASHWLTLYDKDGPYGEVCDCPIGADHDEDGWENNTL